MIPDGKKSVVEKLKSRKGETISETLVALLIAALALTMLAGAITSSAHVVEKSRKKIDSYYAANEEDDGVIRMSGTGKNGTITISDTDTAAPGGLELQTFDIVCYENEVFAGNPVISYKLKISRE